MKRFPPISRSARISRFTRILLAFLILIFLSGLFYSHGSFPAFFPGFYSIFGLGVCLLMIFLAVGPGKKFLHRDEDYYDR